jgi:hypothetical protein
MQSLRAAPCLLVVQARRQAADDVTAIRSMDSTTNPCHLGFDQDQGSLRPQRGHSAQI